MTGPLVSCICPTYGRAPDYLHLLQECVYWFTRQTYPHRELVILNDCPVQKLICPTPGVCVVNYPTRYQTLGEKYDALVRLAQGEIILPWEDDDISLPHRIEQAVERLRDADYFNPQQSWYEEAGRLHSDHKHGVCHNASAYRRHVWEQVGGYGPHTGDQDAHFDLVAKSLPSVRMAQRLSDPSEWSYVYRWGVSAFHLSGSWNMAGAYRSAAAAPCIALVEPVMGTDFYHLSTNLAVEPKPWKIRLAGDANRRRLRTP